MPCLNKFIDVIIVFIINADTKVSEKISFIIQNKAFCTGVKLSPKYQTSSCEAFHSVIINFAPKLTAFSYNGMQARYVYRYIYGVLYGQYAMAYTFGDKKNKFGFE